jgi:ATP-dependent Clp protease ATP-binding subunit ClpB
MPPPDMRLVFVGMAPRALCEQLKDPARNGGKDMAALRAQFRPEFLNRVDDIIIFHPLRAEQIGKIVDIQLAAVAKRLEERHIRLELTDAAKAVLAMEGSLVHGARPLKRVISAISSIRCR